ncbi:TetR/AcrR family transcriptional regulator [Mangrovitalea sediminis]|uniref:TetR/AcrR family transcriptional regulator n=1 Tax=Mangrovitalea sediminis TaxID=1982043 RepID=UPI000BE532AA|nr:TetR/AcrR family transcriptional regulator [Mangrovitalea sediminis]
MENVALQNLVSSGHVSDPESPRGRLLLKAARLFREKGYERTTVRDLAAAVGIQSGSIFHHFRTKEDILKAVMQETIQLITARMQAAVDIERDPVAQLRALVRCELESVNGETGEAMAVLVYEWRSLSPDNRAEILVMRDHYEGLWLSALEGVKAAGKLETQPSVARRLLTGALSWTSTWYRPDGRMTLDDLTEQVMLMLKLA